MWWRENKKKTQVRKQDWKKLAIILAKNRALGQKLLTEILRVLQKYPGRFAEMLSSLPECPALAQNTKGVVALFAKSTHSLPETPWPNAKMPSSRLIAKGD